MSDRGLVAITGGGGGIGSAIAMRLAKDGFRIGVIGRKEERLLKTKRMLERSGYDCDIRCADVRNREQIANALKSLITLPQQLTVVVACAGIGGRNDPSAKDRWDNVIRTNLYGTYFTFIESINLFGTSKIPPRHLIAISSILARIGVPEYTAYCSAKAGILGLVRSLAVELACRNIRVNAICPGWVDTPMARKGMLYLAANNNIAPAEARDYALNSVPLGRASAASEIAELVAFLIGEGGKGFTGQTLDVNNGAWMG